MDRGAAMSGEHSAEKDRMRKRAPKWLRPYLPNTSSRLALVSLDRPDAAHWPIRLTQIVGGKTWSISFIRFQTPEPVPTTRVTPPAETDGGAR